MGCFFDLVRSGSLGKSLTTIELAMDQLKLEQNGGAVSRKDFEPFLREFVSHIDVIGDDSVGQPS